MGVSGISTTGVPVDTLGKYRYASLTKTFTALL